MKISRCEAIFVVYTICIIIMNINAVNFSKINFKGAKVNINAFSDTHGNVGSVNNAFEQMKKEDVFVQEKTGVKNVLAIAGDWFTDGNRQNLVTHPDKYLAELQAEMFNGLISEVKKHTKDATVLFTPGNHEYDGGTDLADKIMSSLDSEILVSNLKIENAQGFKRCKSSGKLINEKILEITDDKNPQRIHKVLFLGVAPVNMKYYQYNSDNLGLIDNIYKSQTKVNKDEYSGTVDQLKKKITEFKKENPKGAVVVLSHTGVNLADNLAKESSVDLVFDGHEHKNIVRYVNSTPIIPLSQNFYKTINATVRFDDEGNVLKPEFKFIYPDKNKTRGPLAELYNDLFREDIRPVYSIKAGKKGVSSLGIEGVRKGNSYLANFITDAVMAELKKKVNDVDFFALNSSSIRHPLNVSKKKSVSSLDISNALAGIKGEDAILMITELSGAQIAYLVADNIEFNKDFPEKNPLIHYSGLSVDRTGMLKAIEDGESPQELTRFIIDKNTSEPIEKDKKYKIANPVKYFKKTSNEYIKALQEVSENTGLNLKELFKKYFENSSGTVKATFDVRIY